MKNLFFYRQQTFIQAHLKKWRRGMGVFVLLLFAWNASLHGQACDLTTNLIVNGNFETVNSACINNGCGLTPLNLGCNCVQPWFAPTGSPILRTNVGAPNGPVAIATSAELESIQCKQEAFAQSIGLIPGQPYQLMFQVRKTVGNQPTDIKVFLANGLTNTINNPVDGPCINPGSNWVNLVSQNFTSGSWTTITSNFTPSNSTNNQIVFFPLQTSGALYNAQQICWDDIKLTCSSLLDVSFTDNYIGNNTVQFNGSATGNISGLAATDWCWEFGDGTTGAGQNVSHTYAGPGTYTVCLTIRDGRRCTKKFCRNISIDDCQCGTQSQVLSGSTVTWNNLNNQVIDQDVIVPPGTHLTINNSTIRVKENCKFVVMRGASLTTNNTTMTHYCTDRLWRGIVVWGNRDVEHSNVNFNNPGPGTLGASDPGVARILGGSKLEYAYFGLEPQRWWWDGKNEPLFASITGNQYNINDIEKFWGGIVIGDHAEFFNNRLSAQIGRYPRVNQSHFNNCVFHSNYPFMLNAGAEGVNIWDTDGVSFQSDTFQQVPARGITSSNAAITVYGSLFANNYQGIKIGSSINSTGHTRIGTLAAANGNRFVDNYYGIWSDGVTKMDVMQNTFESHDSAAIRILGTSVFNIQLNAFLSNPVGVDLINTTLTTQQDLNCNYHNADNRGIRVTGNCRGMEFFNNEFNNLTADLYLRGAGQTQGQIFPNQGAPQYPFYNYFSQSEAENDIRTENNQTALFYYTPPNDPSLPAAILARLLPDCDIDDGCSVPNFYFNTLPSLGDQDCSPTNHGGTGTTPQPCTTRPCLDSLFNHLEWLKSQTGTQYATETALTERRFYTDKRLLVDQWLQAKNVPQIVAALTTYNQTDDQQLLSGVYLKTGDLANAAAAVQALPTTTEDEGDFKTVQQMNLAYLSNPSGYTPTPAEDATLMTIGQKPSPAGANGRVLYHTLHSVWLEPIIPAFSGSSPRALEEARPEPLPATLRLAPNPASNQVTVFVDNNAGGLLRVTDMLGKSILETKETESEWTIDTRNLVNGIYFVQQIVNNKVNGTARLVVQH